MHGSSHTKLFWWWGLVDFFARVWLVNLSPVVLYVAVYLAPPIPALPVTSLGLSHSSRHRAKLHLYWSYQKFTKRLSNKTMLLVLHYLSLSSIYIF